MLLYKCVQIKVLREMIPQEMSDVNFCQTKATESSEGILAGSGRRGSWKPGQRLRRKPIAEH